jgi:hypothetical protein
MGSTILVIVACLSGGHDCSPYPITDEIPWSECMSGPTAQVEVQKWLHEHPKRRLKKLACVEPRRVQAYLGRTQA